MFKGQSGIWSILCQLMAILDKLLDMDFKFVLPSIYINFDQQTNFEVNQTQLLSQKYSKNHYNGHISKPILPRCHSPKSLLLLHFTMNLSQTLRINVNMDFAHTYRSRFRLRPSKKICREFLEFERHNLYY